MARNKSGCRACGTTRSSRFRAYEPVIHDVFFKEKGCMKPNSMVVCSACNLRCQYGRTTEYHKAAPPDEATSESDNEEAQSSGDSDSSDSSNEDNISVAPAQPRVEKARSRQFCREKCQLCGVGSSCKFYHYGTSVICMSCYNDQRKIASLNLPANTHHLQVQQDDAVESSESDSSSSSNHMSISIPNEENAISTNVEADQPDQSRIWSKHL